MRKSTYTGRVVYNRKKHVFTGRDAIRILTTVSNFDRATYINWRAMKRIVDHQYHWRLENEIRRINVSALAKKAAEFEKILQGFDKFLDIVVPLLGMVPGGGELLEVVKFLYDFVRENFPVV